METSVNKSSARTTTSRTANVQKGGVGGSKILVVILVLVLIGFGLSLYGYIDAKREITFLVTPDGQLEANRRLVQETLDAVSKLIILPDEDSPFVFTIQNAEELAAQEPFYTNATNGDRLIVFSDRAIIYNPTKDILINVGPVIFQGTEGNDEPLPPPPAPSPDEGESDN